LGATPVGSAWLCGGYPGSAAMVGRMLDRVPLDELQRAWVLTEPEGPRPLPNSLLERYGLSLEEDYGLVSIISAPEDGSSHGATQCLYQPGVSDRYELQRIAEVYFPASLPIQPLASENLRGETGMAHGWINVGWRGEILVSGVEDHPEVMRLMAGTPKPEIGGSTQHVLLLRPSAAHNNGIPIEKKAESVEFKCDLRTKNQFSAGTVKLRLDAMTSNGWVHNVGEKWVHPDQEWKSVSVSVRLKYEYTGIGPVIEWQPGGAGDEIEIFMPRVNWNWFKPADCPL
jgi:hypothetical protein